MAAVRRYTSLLSEVSLPAPEVVAHAADVWTTNPVAALMCMDVFMQHGMSSGYGRLVPTRATNGRVGGGGGGITAGIVRAASVLEWVFDAKHPVLERPVATDAAVLALRRGDVKSRAAILEWVVRYTSRVPMCVCHASPSLAMHVMDGCGVGRPT